MVERLPLAPVGWPRWTGWKIRIEPGADIEPYALTEHDQEATWKLESPPDPPLIWLDAWPVWLGRLPRVSLSDSSTFAGSILEVDAEPGEGHQARHWELVIGRDIPFAAGIDHPAIDLAASPNYRAVTGGCGSLAAPPLCSTARR